MGIMDRTYNIRFLREEDFEGVIKLANKIFGDNYLTHEDMQSILKKSKKGDRNCSFTMTLNEGDGVERLIGFRLTYAPGQWIDSYDPKLELNPEMWGFDPEKVAYMKSNALDEEFRGGGFGRMLLDRGIAETKRMGAEAAVAHIWMNSPGNSAYNYFTRAGGHLVKTYPSYWTDYHTEDMPCIHCGFPCECPAAEMIIDYSTHKEL
jgi:ribosomal protein S18 acetylase RimI-like enzyme